MNTDTPCEYPADATTERKLLVPGGPCLHVCILAMIVNMLMIILRQPLVPGGSCLHVYWR